MIFLSTRAECQKQTTNSVFASASKNSLCRNIWHPVDGFLTVGRNSLFATIGSKPINSQMTNFKFITGKLEVLYCNSQSGQWKTHQISQIRTYNASCGRWPRNRILKIYFSDICWYIFKFPDFWKCSDWSHDVALYVSVLWNKGMILIHNCTVISFYMFNKWLTTYTIFM